MAKPVFTVQVRELVEFALRGGDLGGRSDFVGADRALAGTRGHQRLQRSRPAGYQKEVPVCREVEIEELILRVQGRIDGVWRTAAEARLEEIKTIRGPWDRQADPLHWAQAKCYGWMYAQEHALERIVLQLTYLDLETGAVTEFEERFGRAELSDFSAAATAIYLEWIGDRHRWRQARDQSIRALGFPYPRYRPGQRELAVAAYRALARGGRLFIEAPTGIGKTMSVLFPALKALAAGRLEQIFYLTARTVGRTVAEKGLADLRRAGLRLQGLTLTARDKICAQPGPPCDPGRCPRARGYYDRVKPAMRAALAAEEITRPVLERVGAAHQVCPFELSLELSAWVDAIICDYNYVFDPEAYLRRHFAGETNPCAFLVDEAHNLVDRGREMFSADLSSGELRQAQRALKGPLPRCARALGRLGAAIRELGRAPAEAEEAGEGAALGGEMDLFAGVKSVDKGSEHSIDKSILCSDPIPAPLPPLVEEALGVAEGWLARNEPAEFRQALLELYFRLRSFRRTVRIYDERFVTMAAPGPAGWVRLFCLDPSLLLRQALDQGRAALFFSATLTPREYYQALLGGRAEDGWLQLPSPFAPKRLAVLVHDGIRTQLKARAGTLREVAEAIGALIQGRAGNYLVYLSSYQYLTAVREQFHGLYPEVAILAQRPGMSEAEREAFLEAFAAEHARTLVGFAVLGGVFGEGIDLVGERLIGAIIVGVGLPQLCAERNLIRDYFQERTGVGFDFAYTFPGMNRVLQATGRVIRSEADRGVVLLIDTRFAEPRCRRLFPAAWQPERVRSASEIRAAVRRFWQE